MKMLIVCAMTASLAASSVFAGTLNKVVVEQEPAVVQTTPVAPASSLSPEMVAAGLGILLLVAVLSNKSTTSTNSTVTMAKN